MGKESKQTSPIAAPFGTVFAPRMAICQYREGAWQPWVMQDTGPLPMHPAAHVFHYASCCFEGLKAYKFDNGDVRMFRMDKNIERMRMSARMLCLPEPDTQTLDDMIRATVRENDADIPASPASLYLRPTLIGTEPNIGKASSKSIEAMLFILASPVGDYFKDGVSPLKVIVDDESPRSTPEFGMAKAGANYAQALRTIDAAKRDHGADQVLFAPGDDAQETGAANFILANDEEVVTKDLDGSFLHGVTRESLLTIAKDMGYRVSERKIGVEELLEFSRTGEAGLSGTAAVLAPIGEFVYRGQSHTVGDGEAGPNIMKLRDALIDIQLGKAEDTHNWLTAP